MSGDMISTVVEYIWIPLVTALSILWRRVSGLDTRTQLIQQHDRTELIRRTEDRARNALDRKEALEKINSHHQTVMSKLDKVDERLSTIIKNARE